LTSLRQDRSAGDRQARPIVLVHGLFGSQNDPRILAAFGGRRVLAPDLLGYGRYRDIPTTGLSLLDQARHVVKHIDETALGRVHLVGHSVGGAIAAMVAIHCGDRLASLTSVEGNFTLKDAFWTRTISRQDDAEAEAMMASYRADPVAWFRSVGVSTSPWSDQLARNWLDHQPASTIKAQATAVVKATEDPEYLAALEKIFRSTLSASLIAGELSSSAWDTPHWANEYCSMRVNIAGAGHMMMAQDPEAYAKAVMACVDWAETGPQR